MGHDATDRPGRPTERIDLRRMRWRSRQAGEGGETKDELILCAQPRTVSVRRIRVAGTLPGDGVAYLTDPRIRAGVRAALRHHLGLDIPPLSDGAAAAAGRL